ncbi:hypothetical protein ACFWBH_31930 [Streptomyces sp. NPDC059999]|uniref:hypothetical protein n=1 Tax=Streptomyces sp. NPDC059999 TaxID=3347030 RepID=UPI0036CC52C7
MPAEQCHQGRRQPRLQGPPVGHGVPGADPGQHLRGRRPLGRLLEQAGPYEVEQFGGHAGQVGFRFDDAQE